MQVNPMELVLEEHARNRSEVSITLRDGSGIRGRIKDYDGYVVLLDGTPQTVVYRHAILKLAAAGQPAKAERQVPRPKVQAQKRPPKTAPAERPAFKDTAEAHGELSPMGEAMLKWLKSQKGGG